MVSHTHNNTGYQCISLYDAAKKVNSLFHRNKRQSNLLLIRKPRKMLGLHQHFRLEKKLLFGLTLVVSLDRWPPVS